LVKSIPAWAGKEQPKPNSSSYIAFKENTCTFIAEDKTTVKGTYTIKADAAQTCALYINNKAPKIISLQNGLLALSDYADDAEVFLYEKVK